VLTQVVGLADGADGTVCAGEGYGTGGARRGGGGILTVYTIVLIISRDFCWSGRGPGAGPHPRTDAPIPCKRRRDRHHWRAYGLSRCGGGTHEQCVAAYCFAIAIPSPIGRCPIACLADLPSAAQSAAEGHMLVGMHAMQCTARRSVQRTHSTIHNRLET
jgi:hypothetical protein